MQRFHDIPAVLVRTGDLVMGLKVHHVEHRPPQYVRIWFDDDKFVHAHANDMVPVEGPERSTS